MLQNSYESLSLAINALTKAGFTDGFKAVGTKFIATNSDNKYLPSELSIVHTYRFEGMTNPQDDSIVFGVEADDGVKGTLVMSYSSKHNQNVELIKQIPEAN